MTRRLAVVAAGLAAAASLALAPSANACVGPVCDQINQVCKLVGVEGCIQ